jgi:hypothetical protein
MDLTEVSPFMKSRGSFELLAILLPVKGDYGFGRAIVDIKFFCSLNKTYCTFLIEQFRLMIRSRNSSLMWLVIFVYFL